MQASDSYEHAFLNDHEAAVIDGLDFQVERAEEHCLVRGNSLAVNVLTRWYAS
ncbi:hypothetical protein [Corynebacterium doosanense]|uniref:hypothetical protein n=1 Tax=Corynebacterium doosanense TaxID=1121358 RepID=UPI0003A307E3|nr:hypothetical protein [Corynebacterium doosanense]